MALLIIFFIKKIIKIDCKWKEQEYDKEDTLITDEIINFLLRICLR